MALVISRRVGESIVLVSEKTGERIELVFKSVNNKGVKVLCMDETRNFQVHRKEKIETCKYCLNLVKDCICY